MNSVHEQCTESKLSRVHQVHNLAQPVRTGCAHCAQAGRVVASVGPCRGPLLSRIVAKPDRVVECTCALARRVTASLPSPSVTMQFFVSRHESPATRRVALCCVRTTPYRMPILAISQGCIAGMLGHIVAPAARRA